MAVPAACSLRTTALRGQGRTRRDSPFARDHSEMAGPGALRKKMARWWNRLGGRPVGHAASPRLMQLLQGAEYHRSNTDNTNDRKRNACPFTMPSAVCPTIRLLYRPDTANASEKSRFRRKIKGVRHIFGGCGTGEGGGGKGLPAVVSKNAPDPFNFTGKSFRLRPTGLPVMGWLR